MFSGIKKFFGIKEKPILNPAIFNHPLAEKTSWKPKASGGANFKTRTLKEVSSSELHYKGSIGGLFFALAFTIVPIIGIVIFLASGFFSKDEGFTYAFLFIFIFPAVGIYLLYIHLRPIVLDKRLGYFYKSFKKPVNSLHSKNTKNHFKLDTIAALQIISEYVRSKNSSYTSYELNFVFEDGLRYNIVDHANYKSIQKEAIIIAEFIGVPVWDAINSQTYQPTHKKKNMDTNTPYDSAGYDSTKRYRDM